MMEKKEVQAQAAIVSVAGDQRRHERVELKLGLTFMILDEGQAFDRFMALEVRNRRTTLRNLEGFHEAHSENISEGGLKICGRAEELKGHSLTPGTYLDLSIALPGSSRFVRAVGVVMWSNLALREFQAGVCFLDVDREDAEAVKEVVNMMQSSQKH